MAPLPGLGLPHKTPPFLWGFLNKGSFTAWGRHPHAQPPTWRTRVSLFVWVIPFDLSSLGDPVRNYASAGLALRIIWPHKPHHYVKVLTPSGGNLSFSWQYISQVPTNCFLLQNANPRHRITAYINVSGRSLPDWRTKFLTLRLLQPLRQKKEQRICYITDVKTPSLKHLVGTLLATTQCRFSLIVKAPSYDVMEVCTYSCWCTTSWPH
jgi:hypothetical protein